MSNPIARNLLQEDRDGVRIMTLDRPEKRNAVDMAFMEEIVSAVRYANMDPDVGCILLTGNGPAFCAGGDVKEMTAARDDQAAYNDERCELTARMLHGLTYIHTPVVCAVNGNALGAGASLAMAGDMALMAATATIGFPEMRYGYVPSQVIPSLLQQVGRRAAFEILAFGRALSAEEALRLGLVNRVVPDADLFDEAMQTAIALAGADRHAMGTMKRNLNAIDGLPLREADRAVRTLTTIPV